jgi:hypothetical protein
MSATLQVVRPAGSRAETAVVLLAVLAVGIAATLLARANSQQGKPPVLQDWQLSSFYDLTASDQAIYNALNTAAETLWVIFDDEGIWATVPELADPEIGVPPFIRDVSWKQTGEVQWAREQAASFDGATAYYGHGGKLPKQGAYLLILNHAHKGAGYVNQSIVWLNPDPAAPAPATLNQDSLVRQGWRQVVAYTGAQEVRRLRGSN